MSITHARFSRQASFIAKKAADWSADCLMLEEYLMQPVRDEPVERFLREMRARLDHIENLHKGEKS